MLAQTGGQRVNIEFQVEQSEHEAARAIADKLGMKVEDAMTIMLRRFVAEKGLPFPMREPANDVEPAKAPAHGVSLARLSAVAAESGKAAVARHANAGRVSAIADPTMSAGEGSLQIHSGVSR